MTNSVDQNTQVNSPDRSRPGKPLPTDRLSIETQFSVLRGYAATSGNERKAVTNEEVGKTIGMNPNSVSLCNPFWESIGLIERDGRKQRPSDAVFDYFQAYQWNQETAAAKLAGALSGAWFYSALMSKLSFRPLSRIEAAGFLADEIKASLRYRDNLLLVLEYMKQVGLVSIEGDTVSLIQNRQGDGKPLLPPGDTSPPVEKPLGGNEPPMIGMKRFAIHVPDKSDVVISLPDDIDQEDWEMVLEVIQKYVNRWKRFSSAKVDE